MNPAIALRPDYDRDLAEAREYVERGEALLKRVEQLVAIHVEKPARKEG